MKLINLAPLPVDAVTDWVGRQVTERVPKADMSERDPEFIARTVGPYRELARRYFRAEVRGLDRIPEDRPILLVGNHSGSNVSPEVMVTTLAFARRFGPDRPFYQLAHNLVMAVPVLGSFLAKFGTITANPDSTRAALPWTWRWPTSTSPGSCTGRCPAWRRTTNTRSWGE